MPRPYSLDLREKAINFVKAGKSVESVAKRLGINCESIMRWLRKEKAGEGIGHRKLGRKLHSGRKVSEEDFRKYVMENPNKTATQIGKELGMSKNAACVNMRRIGFTFKKKRFQILDKKKMLEKHS